MSRPRRVYVGRSESQANAEALARRSGTYADANARSLEMKFDRGRYRPRGLRGLVYQLRRAYAEEVPSRIHVHQTDGGDTPAWSPEFSRHLTAGDAATDGEDPYLTPFRSALTTWADPHRAGIVHAVVEGDATPTEAAVAAGVPAWGDEVAICKHKLNLTAVDLSSEAGNETAARPPFVSQDHTMEVNAAQLQDIMRHQQSYAPYLEETGGKQQGRKWVLSKHHFGIGKSSDCDLQIGGWFTPKLIAKITRQSDGYYLIPDKKGRLRLNGNPLTQRIKLRNLDKLQVRGIALTYYQPAAAQKPDA